MTVPRGEAQVLFGPHAQKNPLLVCKFFWNPGVQIFSEVLMCSMTNLATLTITYLQIV
jgi:hypothetical protein